MNNFYNADEWAYTTLLKQHHASLVREFDQWLPAQWIQNAEHKIDQKGTWHFVPFLTRGKTVEYFLHRCPTVQTIMQAVPVFDNCTFSIMGPGAVIKPHQGHSNQHLRVHLGIRTSGKAWIRVGDQTQHWSNGEVLIFQDSETHSAENPDTDYRVVLLFDICRSDYFDHRSNGIKGTL
jgi:aspartyl/asparaginyl beta-hydroxylase (cupin superfamily)